MGVVLNVNSPQITKLIEILLIDPWSCESNCCSNPWKGMEGKQNESPQQN